MVAVGPRVSKEEFMHALNLSAQNPQHEQFYRAMRVSTSTPDSIQHPTKHIPPRQPHMNNKLIFPG